MVRRRTLLTASTGGLLWLAGCGGLRSDGTPPAESSAGPATEVPSGPYWYPHAQLTGNRVVSGATDLRSTQAVQVTVDSRPVWLVATPAPRGSYWTGVTADGTATRWQVSDGSVSKETRLQPQAAEHPPVVAGGDTQQGLLTRPSAMGPNGGQMVTPMGRIPRRLFVAANGDLVVDGDDRHRLSIDAPPDVRPAALGDGTYVVYGDETGRYRHGALGDSLEPSSLVVVDPTTPAVVTRTVLDAPVVFEGLQPLVADLDGDGDPEIVTTIADSENGARIAVYSTAGKRIATGPVYGPGWRHQLAVAPFGPDGATELAVVLKPHVTRRLEYYRLVDGDLNVRATVDGVSSHTYGSRNIDGAIAADVDGDGAVELLVPTADRRKLVVVTRTPGEAQRQWEWTLGAQVTSNITGVALDNGDTTVLNKANGHTGTYSVRC